MSETVTVGSAAPAPGRKFWFVQLADGISRSNFATLLYSAFTAIGLLAFFTWVGLPLGLGTVTIAHAAFGTAFVVAVVRSRLVQLAGSLEGASQDLGAGWLATFLLVTLPSIAPAVLAGLGD